MITIGAPCELSKVSSIIPSERCCASLVPRMQVNDVISTGSGKLVVVLPCHTAYTACSSSPGDIKHCRQESCNDCVVDEVTC